jgi:hypothetical protein
MVVNFLATRVNKFTSADEKKLMRCLKDLNKTELHLECDDERKLTLTTHADASYGVHQDFKSQSAATTLGSGAVVATSHKQKIVTKSAA